METTHKFYAGIGSRNTPEDILDKMYYLGVFFAELKYCLRSGAANGADSAFENGCDAAFGLKDIWLPWPGFNGRGRNDGQYPNEKHEELASYLHPSWEYLKQGPKKLHSRNIGQVMGADLTQLVTFVVCWTPDGCESEQTRLKVTGGTATAICAASRLHIPVFNLKNPDALERLEKFLKLKLPVH